MEFNKIYTGCCYSVLKTFPDNSIHCIITSPPYWALRDYKVKPTDWTAITYTLFGFEINVPAQTCCLGLEKDLFAFIGHLVLIFRECKRVLRDDGTMWVNMGDSYAVSSMTGGNNGYNKQGVYKKERQFFGKKNLSSFLKPKDMCGIPWMLAFALREDGWYLRQDIIWSKPNPMPESVNDRCTKSHEYVFLLTKSKKYYFDAKAIATPIKDKTLSTYGCEVKGNGDGSGLIASENWANSLKIRKPKEWKMPDGWDTGSGGHGAFHRNGREKGKTHKNLKDKGLPVHSMHIARLKGVGESDTMAINGSKIKGHSGNYDANGNIIGDGKANKRSVWEVSTFAFKDAHFATFPPNLIIDCIKAGCTEGGTVLDIFGGSGTTAEVASKLSRNWILIEIGNHNVQIAKKRLHKSLGLFNPIKN